MSATAAGGKQANETEIFSLQAQVYALDKAQKWTPLTKEVVPVQFLRNSTDQQVRILAMDGASVVVVNSQLVQGMQYRRPSETFVQWFDSQHILYGLNLTSVQDAEGFQREFETATKNAATATDVKAAKPAATMTKTTSGNALSQQADSTPLQTTMAKMSVNGGATTTSSNNNLSASKESQAATQKRIKELELQIVAVEAEKAAMVEQLASNSK